jgi:hypothetical protein
MRTTARTWYLVATAWLLAAGAAGSAPMPEPTLLRRLPPRMLDRMAASGMPDVNGLVGRNRGQWLHVALQRGAMLPLAVAAARGDRERAEAAWRAVDAAFSRQLPSGSFRMGSLEGRAPTRGDDLSGTSFWIGELCHALLVVQACPLGNDFADRIQALMPKIRRAAAWLHQGKAELEQYDRQTANRLGFDAQAFGLAGVVLADPALRETGDHFLRLALALQRPDGVLLEKGGGDSSYQAVSLLRLQVYACYLPSPELEAAIARGVRWELGRVKDTGEVDVSDNTRVRPGGERFLGAEKAVSYSEVALSLLYYWARRDDQQALTAAERAFDYAVRSRP